MCWPRVGEANPLFSVYIALWRSTALAIIYNVVGRQRNLGLMKNLSVFILARKILFCSIIFPHSHKRTCPSTLNAPVRLVYGYRREGEGSRGSWKLYMLKKGQVFLLLKKRGYSPQSITVPTWSEKNGWKCIRDIQNHLLSISLIVIKYKIIHYTEVPRININ